MKPQDIKEYYFKEGCYIEEWLNDTGHPDMSVARVRVAPQAITKLHALRKTQERYVILSGKGLVTVGENSWLVQDKDVVTIAPDTAQKIVNQTDNDLIFLAICTPRFDQDNYLQLEE